MTAAQHVRHVRIAGPRRHGVPLCRRCGNVQLESKKRRELGLCLQCAGLGSKRPFAECAGSHALRSLLKQRAITRQALADEMGVPVACLAMWLLGRGRPTRFYRSMLDRDYEIPTTAWPEMNCGRRRAESTAPKQRLVELCPTCQRPLPRKGCG